VGVLSVFREIVRITNLSGGMNPADDQLRTGTPIAPSIRMRRPLPKVIPICWAALMFSVALHPAFAGQGRGRYRIESRSSRAGSVQERFSAGQLAVLEKLNRADVAHLERLPELVVPEWWSDELSYSVLPMQYPPGEALPTFLVVYLPGQLFGAYEFGSLVRWGPLSSGARNSPTRPGTFNLNWRSTGRASTVNPDWFMRWYFNFGNREGLAFHAYALPGYPASHGCIRLLERDAEWLFEWGQSWVFDRKGTRLVTPGTPVFIVGGYDFDAAPPWRSPGWLSAIIELPAAFMSDGSLAEQSP
jgi:hypothetical protein